MTREPYPFPTIKIADKRDLLGFEYEDFEIQDYVAHAHIPAKVSK